MDVENWEEKTESRKLRIDNNMTDFDLYSNCQATMDGWPFAFEPVEG